MNGTDRIIFGASGAIVWATATLVFHLYGRFFFENGDLVFAATVLGAVAGFVTLFTGLTMARRIPRARFRFAALVFGVPGMLLEVPVLLDFAAWMPTLRPETAGAYATMLLAGYAILFLIASLLEEATANEKSV